MRQSLQLRLGQHLTMTPQLQQAIRLLQLSSLDLQAEIQTVLDSNLMLERSDDTPDPEVPTAEAALSETVPPAQDRTETPTDTIPNELPVDTEWGDVYDSYDGSTSYSRGDDDDNRDLPAGYLPSTTYDLVNAGQAVDRSDIQESRLREWLREVRQLVVIELGAGTDVPSSSSFFSATCLLQEALFGVSSCTYWRSSVGARLECICSRCWTTAIT